MAKTFTAWITKYALTQGILKMEVTDCFEISEHMVGSRNGPYTHHFHKPYWYDNEKEAIQHAIQMVKNKLASIDRQKTKFKKMEDELQDKLVKCTGK